jgi:hypothetical protein
VQRDEFLTKTARNGRVRKKKKHRIAQSSFLTNAGQAREPLRQSE